MIKRLITLILNTIVLISIFTIPYSFIELGAILSILLVFAISIDGFSLIYWYETPNDKRLLMSFKLFKKLVMNNPNAYRFDNIYRAVRIGLWGYKLVYFDSLWSNLRYIIFMITMYKNKNMYLKNR